MNGLLIIDKPKGMTSFDVVRRVRRLLGVRRVGHAGTLDPLATGVLPVAVGEGTRILEFLFGEDKTYRARLKLGEITDTQDAEGSVIETHPADGVDAAMVRAAAAAMTGRILQVPPMFSALKRDGVPLYRLARRGIEIAREPREVFVRRLDVLEIDLPFVTIEVDCSKGTYIRTLCHDLGLRLGPGAHLTSLRRTACGPFDEQESILLEEMEEAGPPWPLLSLAESLRGFSPLEVGSAGATRLRDGIPPAGVEIEGEVDAAEGETVLLLHQGTLRAVARFAPGRTREKRGDFELLKVFHPA